MKVGDKMRTAGELCEILAVEREYKYPIPGRYTVRFENGRVVENYPGYLLKPCDDISVPVAPHKE